jgi:hypothetical protein
MGGSSSRSGSAQRWARPYAQAGATAAQDVFQANQPGLQGLTSSVQGMVPGLMGMFQQGNGGVQAAQGYAQDVLGGKYMQGNPYLDQIIGKAGRGITDQVNSQFTMAGRYGSGAHTGVLANSLADMESGLRYQDYGAQQGRMDQMAGLAPALSQAGYIGVPEILQTAGLGAELPYTGLGAYTGALGNVFNGSVQKQSGLGSIMQGIGAGLGTAAQAGAFSDRRLKRAIEKLGELADGLGVYSWRYVWGGPRAVGVMADEVEVLRPWALGPRVGGFATVNYGAL